MPMQLEIIRASEFIRVGAEGQFDLAASKAAFTTIVSACRKRAIHHAVLDLRAVQTGPTPVFTTTDLLALVNTFPEVGFTRELRLAILYRSDPHKRARLFAFLSTLRGWHVQAFGEFERALLWLSTGEEAAAEPPKASVGKAIPIRVAAGGTGARVRAVPPMSRPSGVLAGQGPLTSTAVAQGQKAAPLLVRKKAARLHRV
jgi:hypothetical protein